MVTEFVSPQNQDDSWHFAVITYTGLRYRLYLDNKQVDKQYANGQYSPSLIHYVVI